MGAALLKAQRRVALHEVGHAIASHAVGVRIIGNVWYSPRQLKGAVEIETTPMESLADFTRSAIISLAGYAAWYIDDGREFRYSDFERTCRTDLKLVKSELERGGFALRTSGTIQELCKMAHHDARLILGSSACLRCLGPLCELLKSRESIPGAEVHEILEGWGLIFACARELTIYQSADSR